MIWAAFIIFPILFGIGLVAMRRVPRMAWLTLIVLIAIVEMALLGKPSDSWEVSHTASLWFLAVVLPWSAIASFVVFTPYYQHKFIAGIGAPLAYFALLAISLLAGDTLGVIPQ